VCTALGLVIGLTAGSAVAAFMIKNVDKARRTADALRSLRMAVAVVIIFSVTVVPFKSSLPDRGVPDLCAWPLTVGCPLILAWLFLGLGPAGGSPALWRPPSQCSASGIIGNADPAHVRGRPGPASSGP